jgi:hypothetical protein
MVPRWQQGATTATATATTGEKKRFYGLFKSDLSNWIDLTYKRNVLQV